MFNRQKFNRGKFNASGDSLPVSGAAAMILQGDASAFLSIQAPESTVGFDLGIIAKPTRKIQPPSSKIYVTLAANGRQTLRKFGITDTIKLQLSAEGETTGVITAPDVLAEITTGLKGSETRILRAAAPLARISMVTAATASRRIRASTVTVVINTIMKGNPSRRYFAGAPTVKPTLGLYGWADMYGYAILELEGLVLPVGGDLRIDTGQMTVTLNGQDVTRYVSRNSEFFKLRPGDNIILYEDGAANRNISYNILWKDLWL